MEQSFDNLYDEFDKLFSKEKLTPRLIITYTPVIVKAVQEVGKQYKLSGKEKKDLFFLVINKIIKENKNMTDEEKQGLSDFIEMILPVVVDTIVYAYKSDAFSKISGKTSKLFTCCKK